MHIFFKKWLTNVYLYAVLSSQGKQAITKVQWYEVKGVSEEKSSKDVG